MNWDPDLYLRFKQQRFLPFDDLMRGIDDRPGLHAVDLGCGTGELTRRLADKLPESTVLGIDNSESMLERTTKHARAGLAFERRSIEDLLAGGESWDLIFSNAALHWVENHGRIFPELFGCLKCGGALAVQMPSNHRHPVQRAVQDVARREPFAGVLQGWVRESPVLEIDAYAQLLDEADAEKVNVMEKVYLHHFPDAGAVFEWTRGTVLRPYLSRLGKSGPDFEQELSGEIRRILGKGPVCYTFRRTFVWAAKPMASG